MKKSIFLLGISIFLLLPFKEVKSENPIQKNEMRKFCRDIHPQTTLVMRKCLNHSILFSLNELKEVFTESELTEIHFFLKKYCNKSMENSYENLEPPLGTLYPINVGLCIVHFLEDIIQFLKYGVIYSSYNDWNYLVEN